MLDSFKNNLIHSMTQTKLTRLTPVTPISARLSCRLLSAMTAKSFHNSVCLCPVFCKEDYSRKGRFMLRLLSCPRSLHVQRRHRFPPPCLDSCCSSLLLAPLSSTYDGSLNMFVSICRIWPNTVRRFNISPQTILDGKEGLQRIHQLLLNW